MTKEINVTNVYILLKEIKLYTNIDFKANELLKKLIFKFKLLNYIYFFSIFLISIILGIAVKLKSYTKIINPNPVIDNKQPKHTINQLKFAFVIAF